MVYMDIRSKYTCMCVCEYAYVYKVQIKYLIAGIITKKSIKVVKTQTKEKRHVRVGTYRRKIVRKWET